MNSAVKIKYIVFIPGKLHTWTFSVGDGVRLSFSFVVTKNTLSGFKFLQCSFVLRLEV